MRIEAEERDVELHDVGRERERRVGPASDVGFGRVVVMVVSLGVMVGVTRVFLFAE